MRKISKRLSLLAIVSLVAFLVSPLITYAGTEFTVPSLHEVENQWNKKSLNLAGPVYQVVTKQIEPVESWGEIVRVNTTTTDSIIFDEKGQFVFQYRIQGAVIPDTWGQNHVKYWYDISRDSTIVRISFDDGDIIHKYYNTYDDKARITSQTKYYGRKRMSRQTFQYTPSGYEGEFFYEGNKSNKFEFKNSELTYAYAPGLNSMKYDADGRPIKNTKNWGILGTTYYYFQRDSHGNVIKAGNENELKKNNPSVYKYDEYGNWIERRTRGKDGKLSSSYTKREIIYKTPDEIIAAKKAEQERIERFEADLRKKAQENATKFVENKRALFAEYLMSAAEQYIDNCTPIKSFAVHGDSYDFEFSDGEKVSDVQFTTRHNGTDHFRGVGNLLSSDMRIVMIMKQSQQGPKWYVVKYGDIAKFDFDPNKTTDWVKIYRDKFSMRDDIDDERIYQIWNDELQRQVNNSNYEYHNLLNGYVEKNAGSVCVNELVDAYEKGFVSPALANKEEEKRGLDDYKKFKEDERRKNLCSLAFYACNFNDKAKPEADKLKKFEINGESFYFKFKDNSEISSVKFDTSLDGRDVNVYLSDDEQYAIVLKRIYADYYIFIVKIGDGKVETVNFISPKDALKFIFPQSVSHRYNTGFS